MTLDASGRLLVGTTSNVFGERLTVNNWITAGDLTRVALMGQDGTDVVMGAYSNHNLVLRTNNTTRLTIVSTGAATFSANVSAPIFTSTGGRGTSFGFRLPDWQIYNTSSGNALAFSNYTTDFMTIKSNGIINLSNVPSSSAGLSSGDVYKTVAGVLMIV
jgi:hypothetical protein